MGKPHAPEAFEFDPKSQSRFSVRLSVLVAVVDVWRMRVGVHERFVAVGMRVRFAV